MSKEIEQHSEFQKVVKRLILHETEKVKLRKSTPTFIRAAIRLTISSPPLLHPIQQQ